MQQSTGTAVEAESVDDQIAAALLMALRRTNPLALLMGDSGDEVLVDGNFSFPILAAELRKELRRRHLLAL
jgi:hypothetical protein